MWEILNIVVVFRGKVVHASMQWKGAGAEHLAEKWTGILLLFQQQLNLQLQN